MISIKAQNLLVIITTDPCYFMFQNSLNNIGQATDKQLVQLVEWAKQIPHFVSLPIDDQVLLLRSGKDYS